MPCHRDELHENGTRLYEWAEKWQKNFIVGNCKVMHLGENDIFSKQPGKIKAIGTQEKTAKWIVYYLLKHDMSAIRKFYEFLTAVCT